MSRDILAAKPKLRLLVYRALFTVGPLVPLFLARCIGYGIGLAFWFFDARGRRIVAANLAPLMPQASASSLRRSVRRSYILFSFSIIENLHVHQPPKNILRPPGLRIDDPWGTWRHGPMQGPMITVTHHANWELSASLAHHRGHLECLHAISLSHGDPEIDKLFDRYRAQAGVVALRLETAPLASLRALNQGAVVGIVGDRDYTHHGLLVTVCGKALRIPVCTASAAGPTGAPIVPTWLARSGWTRFRHFAGRPLRADPNLPKREEIKRLCHSLAHWFERVLRAAPSQWVAFHPVWDEPKGLGAPPCWV